MSDRPNVVLVVMDTVRARDVTPATAPTFHELAEAGTGYARAFANAPWTLPSHASLFSSQYPSEHAPSEGSGWPGEDTRLVVEAFRDAGYHTAAVSNNMWLTEEFGFDRGFETIQNGWELDGVAASHDEWAPAGADPRSEADASDGVDARALDDGAAASVEWVDDWLAGTDAPFFLFANFIEAHIEYEPPREYAEPFLPDGWRYEEATALQQDPREYDVGAYDLSDEEFAALGGLYRGEIAYLDDRLADLRRTLVERGEWEDTVFVVVGDHGENVGDCGFFGHQYCIADTLLRVPFVVHGGPFADGPTRSADLVELLDLAPTLLDAADIDDKPARAQFRGRSLHPDADAPAREYVVAEYPRPQPSIETLAERFEEIPDRVRTYDRSIRSVRSERFRFVARSDGTEALYDVSASPGRHRRPAGADRPDERHDVADTHPEAVDRLRTELHERLDDDAWDDGMSSRRNREMADETAERLRDLGYL